ncbi:hypothetical protein J6590_096187, partial [Homalodisca vitripennis]
TEDNLPLWRNSWKKENITKQPFLSTKPFCFTDRTTRKTRVSTRAINILIRFVPTVMGTTGLEAADRSFPDLGIMVTELEVLWSGDVSRRKVCPTAVKSTRSEMGCSPAPLHDGGGSTSSTLARKERPRVLLPSALIKEFNPFRDVFCGQHAVVSITSDDCRSAYADERVGESVGDEELEVEGEALGGVLGRMGVAIPIIFS